MPTSSAVSGKKELSNHLNRQLGFYSLAAAAAGVTALALAQPAAGEVVVTRKTIPIPLTPRDMQQPVNISMANDGIDNFSFILSSSSGINKGTRELLVGGIDRGRDGHEGAHNSIFIGGDTYGVAFALPRGAKIGPSTHFGSSSALVECTNGTSSGFYSKGYWKGNLKNHYLGVRFLIDGQVHYGWIRLTATTDVKLEKPTLAATITAYAYETVANQPILAGTAEKSAASLEVPEKIQNPTGPSLGMLAAGADGLPLWRQEAIRSSQ